MGIQLVRCPKCSSPMVKRSGRYGDFYGCSRYPKCTATLDPRDAVKQAQPQQPKKEFKPSVYQLAIFDFISNQTGNALVEAVAGSGKTTTIVKALELTPKTAKVIFLAFNKHIQEELARRAPGHVRVQTMHSLGFSALRNGLPFKPEVDDGKLMGIIKELLPNYEVDGHLRAPLSSLVGLAKNTLVDPEDLAALSTMADRYGVDLNGDGERLLPMVAQAMRICAERTSVIDFDDMIWLPIRLNLHLETYDWLFVDECLPYHTPVLLADGRSMEIGKIVDDNVQADVLSYDTSTGKQKACRITGWHKILNRKPLVKVKVSCSHYSNFVVCTTNHKIYANGEWIEAGLLKPGMIVQIETSARKSQHYKITSTGLDVLSKIMSDKNNDPNFKRGTSTSNITEATRGGNGRALTLPQQLMLDAMGDGWIAEYSIKTRMGRGSGYPNCYKADLANPDLMIAVELDGCGHGGAASRATDDKKDDLLVGLGWTVVRISNQEVIKDLEGCIALVMSQVDCPVEAMIESIEPTEVPGYYVYDITVKDYHNFYANGILVHNCQDLNASQIELLMRSIRPGTGRVIAVGDRHQSIYGWRGADCEAIPKLIEALDATVLPLSITYRCPRSHVDLAKEIVPQIEAAEDAAIGTVEYTSYMKAMTIVQDGDLVLCRVNAPLISTCYTLIKQGRKAVIRGRDIGKNLISFIDKLKPVDVFDLMLKVNAYRTMEVARLESAGRESQVQSLQDKCDCIVELCDGVRDLSELRYRITSIFDDETKTGIILSSVHRAKGDESNRVWILKPELMPHPMAKQDWQVEQESNIKYVAVTRSKETLVFVQGM